MVVFASAVLSGCGASSGSAASNGRLKVVTTVAPLTSIVSAVAGDRAVVQGLVPEGVNSHTFDPPPSAAKDLAEADLVLVNGLKLEDPTVDLAEANVPSGTPIVEVGTKVLPTKDYIFDFSFPKKDGKPNPHLWTDPTYALKYAAVIRDALTKAAPKDATVFATNYAAFATRATALSDALRADQESLPASRRVLLTYHDAYAYFAQTYGWKVIGAVQPRNFEDPTPKEVVTLIDQIKSEHVPVIFGSEVFPSKVLAELGSATGARYESTLRDDDLPGEPGDPEHSWEGLMRYDFVTMVTALGGQAPRLKALDTQPATPDRADYPQ